MNTYLLHNRSSKRFIRLLLLFFIMVQGVGSAWGQETLNGSIGRRELTSSSYILNGVTSGYLFIPQKKSNTTYTFTVRSDNSLFAVNTTGKNGEKYAAIDICGDYNDRIGSGNTLILQADANNPASLEAKGGDIGYGIVPGIGLAGSTLRVKGPIKLTAFGERNWTDNVYGAPGIGGNYVNGRDMQMSHHTLSTHGGDIRLSQGARVMINDHVMYTWGGNRTEMLPYIYIEDFATFNAVEVWDNRNAIKDWTATWLGGYVKQGTRLVINYLNPNGYSKPYGWKDVKFYTNASATDQFKFYMEYFNDRDFAFWYHNKNWDYFTIDGIPAGPEKTGKVYMGLYKDDSDKYYKAFQSFSSGTFTLNTRKYPASGTLQATGDITFNGNNNNSRELNTTGDGATFKTTGAAKLKVTYLTCTSGSKLKIDGHVYLANNNSQSIYAYNTAGTPIYQHITTIQNNNTVTKVTYDGKEVNFAQPASDGQVCVWLPKIDGKELRIYTQEGVIYTNIVLITVATNHKPYGSGIDLTVQPTEYDLSKNSVALNTANSGNQTVDFPNASDATKRSYTSPAQTPLVFFDSSSSSKNDAVIKASYTANVTLDNLDISTSSPCLKIDGGAITNITLKGTNKLISTSNHAISIENGTLNLGGEKNNSLIVNGSVSDININAGNGYLILKDGEYSVRAVNSKFQPQNTIVSGGNEVTTPTIYMGASDTQKFYLTSLSNSASYTNFKTSDGNDFPDGRMVFGGTSYFWLGENENLVQAEKAKTAYMFTRNKLIHNFKLKVSPIIAKVNKTLYGSIQDAFAAARNGDQVMLMTDHLLPEGEKPYLTNIRKGEKAQFNLNEHTLTGANHTMNAGDGVLEVNGTGSLNGSFNIEGGLYISSSSVNIGNIFMDGTQVYKVKVNNLANGINNYPYFKLDDATSTYRATYADAGETVIWLPANPAGSIAIIADGTNAVPEPVSEAVMKPVNSNHTNVATAQPAPDITFGNITFADGTDNGSIKVTYGTDAKFSQDNMVLTADKRVRLRGNNKNKAYQIVVNPLATGRTAFFTLSGLRSEIGTAAACAMQVNGNANMMLEKESELYGGRGGSNFTAIAIANDVILTVCNNDTDKGRTSGTLLAQGSYAGSTSKHAVQCTGNGALVVEGGTLVLLNGDDSLQDAVDVPGTGGSPIQFKGGSLRTGSSVRPKTGTVDVYLVTISTGLTPGKSYRYTYKPGKDDSDYTAPKDSYIIPDEDGKIYCWFPKAEAGAADLGQVTLVDPETSQSVSIPIAKVDENDKNVAPIVVSVRNLTTNDEESYGNLKDAFDALQSSASPDYPTHYRLSLLSNIANLRTEQIVPANCEAEFNLGSYNVEVVSGTDVSFEASETSYLHITGKGGNIRNTFKVTGDVFINGIVPLTDATIMREGASVFRTLVSGLTWAEGNDYTYTYGKNTGSFRPHTVEHTGQKLLLGCLWLPDNGSQTELRIVVNSGGSSVEYTAGEITTKTQITEPLPVRTIGVVASVTYGSINRAFNNLSEAFSVGVKKANEAGYGDTESQTATLSLMAGCTFASEFTMNGQCRFDLAGKNLLSATNGKVTVAADARIRLIDSNVGVKGSLQSNITLANPEDFFVAGSIQLEGTVTKSGDAVIYWRTLVNTSYKQEVACVQYDGRTYPVISGEVCLWLPQDNTGKNYDFILLDKDGNTTGDNDGKVTISGVVISANHQNEMTIGVTNEEARISTQKYETLQKAFDAAKTSPLSTAIELLKTIAPDQSITVSSDNISYKDLTLDLGRYAIEEKIGTTAQLVISGKAMLELLSSGSQGRLQVPVKLESDSYFFAGQTINGGNLGIVQDSEVRYRLLVKNLPKGMPDDLYDFNYGDAGAGQQTGKCLVRSGVACLWLKEQKVGKTLTFPVGGGNFYIQNVIIAPNHFNTETYGVNEVAQVNGNKYGILKDAFANGGGKKIVLLKNASLGDEIVVSAKNTELDMAGFNITATDADKTITVEETGTLQIKGKGNLTVYCKIAESDKMISSNGNLIVEPEVNLTVTSQIVLGTSGEMYRVNISGLQASILAKYEYGNQSGEATTSTDGTLCVWLKNNSTPQTFRVDIGDNTWLLPSVVIGQAHNNPVEVLPAEAVAKIGDESFNTLKQAFDAVTNDKNNILLTKNTGADEVLKLPDGVTSPVTFNLGKKELRLDYGSEIDGNTGQLILKDGVLEGNLILKGKVFASGDVRMNNVMVTKDGKTVWRMLLTLPAGTTSFSYQIGADTEVTENTNILTEGGSTVACLWLRSSYMAQDFIVKIDGREYRLPNMIIASTHGNELDVADGSNPVASDVDGNLYASLASALANGVNPVTLQKDIMLLSAQNITKDVTLDLNGFVITSGSGGFDVETGKTFTLQNSKNAGMLAGTFSLTGEGNAVAGKTVKIAGVVLNKDNEDIFRTTVTVDSKEYCRWLRFSALEYDEEITGADGAIWQATVPAGLDNHNMALTAHKLVELTGSGQSWNDNYVNCNLLLSSDAVLNITGLGATKEINRITLHDGAQVKIDNSSQVRATEGIRYIRSLANEDTWESLSLPFSPVRITAVDDQGATYLLNPAYNSGTSGHFWLSTINAGGQLQTVNSSELTANVSYLMAVPCALSGKEITFVSGPNQLLRRDKVTAVKPASGFASYANGTFDELAVKEACYLLNADGDAFELTQPLPSAVAIKPFRGYLLADANTTMVLPTLRIGVATDVEVPSVPNPLRIYVDPGRVVVETPKAEDIRIHRFDGSLVRTLRVPAGQTEIPLARGLYIVNRTKVIISR